MDLESINGIGPKTLKILNNLEIYNLNDLVNYYPYRYNLYQIGSLSNPTNNCLIKAVVHTSPILNFIKRNFNRLSFNALIEDKIIKVVIFNRGFLKPNIIIGKEIYLQGKYEIKNNTFTASNILLKYPDNLIEPVYHLKSGLNNSNLKKIITSALKKFNAHEELPNYLNEKYNFIDLNKALEYIHDPKDSKNLKQALLKLKYQELFDFTFKVNYLKKKNAEEIGAAKAISDEDVNRFINDLPFNLTIDQNKALEEIVNDMRSKIKMNRIVIGDVGSGKTIVCIAATYLNYLAGYQTAFMAPTEVLAIQHYNVINNLFQKYNIPCELLVGSMTKKEKEKVIERLKNNESMVVIGTHALISENVKFNNLGLVITDEQHRFGVNQRKLLSAKGNNPDALYLSATPIPRTYALVLYNDLNVSLIKTKPSGRKDVVTKKVKYEDLREVLSKILEELKNKHQVFVVSPLIEENDEEELNSVITLQKKFADTFKNYRVGLLHGKLKNNEKEAIMNDFKEGVINILISTTVIEVGVDIKNATMMVVFNAERFGLATLHQLRGRVGRNDLECYCYLISDSEHERLKVLEESNDGFYISEQDFKLRKEGDIFGIKQSGTMTFKIANIFEDSKILLQATKDSEQFLDKQEYLKYNKYNDIIKHINNLD